MKLKLTQRPNSDPADPAFDLFLDDVDVTDYVLRDGFKLELTRSGKPIVELRLALSELDDVELPDVILSTIVEG